MLSGDKGLKIVKFFIFIIFKCKNQHLQRIKNKILYNYIRLFVVTSNSIKTFTFLICFFNYVKNLNKLLLRTM